MAVGVVRIDEMPMTKGRGVERKNIEVGYMERYSKRLRKHIWRSGRSIYSVNTTLLAINNFNFEHLCTS